MADEYTQFCEQSYCFFIAEENSNVKGSRRWESITIFTNVKFGISSVNEI